ncbi:MAG TPA: FAD-dependent oxidoreductase [Candidatus Limnocylindrales bacterium]|nr:FAD-dependent oxidoreductase [Candidatus Limnocylindrales bacterium]
MAIGPTLSDRRVRLVGQRWSPRVHELKGFLARSRVKFDWLDPESDPEAHALRDMGPADRAGRPVVLLPDGEVLVDPDVRTLAARLGLPTEPASTLYDLIVVGGGPAGLTAGMHAASEGLHTAVIEQDVPGGQSSHSAMIENYPGLPKSVDGSTLASRMVQQTEKFGADILVTRRATALEPGELRYTVKLDDDTEVVSHAVVLALGVSFRWLDAPGCTALVGAGIYYGAVTAEAAACRDQEVYVLGGGNSAGQAALFLSRFARRVTILTRDESLDETMSHYLVERIERTQNITVSPRTTVEDARGPGRLESLVIRDLTTGESRRVPAQALFVFIGAAPRTEWLDGQVDLDDEGFVLSGDGYVDGRPRGWPLERSPYPLETRLPGVFVAGDARRGAVHRIVVAASEGASAVQFTHHYFRDTPGLRSRFTEPGEQSERR